METFSLYLANIHCEKCETAISRILSSMYSIVNSNSPETLTNKEVILKISSNEVKIQGNRNVNFQHDTKRIIKHFEKAGFKVTSWEITRGNDIVSNSHMDTEDMSDHDEGFFDLVGFYQRFTSSKSEKKHLKYCKVCQDKHAETNKQESSTDTSSLETIVVDTPTKEFRASFLVKGMTCSACVQTVSDTLASILGESSTKAATDEPNFSVNLIQQSVVAIIPNKQVVNKIIDGINDLGFDCSLVEVLPVQRTINTRVTAIISGMTCAACVNSIESVVNQLPFILESGVNLVTKTGQFVLQDDDGSNIKKLQETVEDCGFDFSLVKQEKINYTSSKTKPRTINIKVDGMFCNHCPELIMNYLSNYGDAVVIQDPISLKNPYIKFTYIPTENTTVRKFLGDLNHIHAKDDSYEITDLPGPFECELIRPVSIDEQVKLLAKRELLGLAIRLAAATVFVIPTFVFGIVAMSLLPKSNRFRMWVEEPLWTGNVSRNSWILFLLATPIYFFVADTFHRKAIKEIRSLWVHKNSFTARLLRFGSMNLLMSIGTSVAYFASIVLIGLSSQQKPKTHMGFHTTYFDSVVFLTFFLLIGKLLQSYSKRKTADAVSQLANLQERQATLVDKSGDNAQRVDIELLEVGDYIKIGTGESPPVDCVIVEGNAEFDESALTGESTPVKHLTGHQIFSGTVNISSTSIVAKVTSLEADSLLSQIVTTVRDGQLRKAPMERTADLITGSFVPVIIFLSIITWIIWISLGYSGALPESYLDIDIGGWTVWSLEFAIAVIVIACPCGIGLAAPTALFVGSGLAAKYGILAKGGGVAFQDGASTNVVCFDKTGTLTKGELTITDYSFITKSDVDKQFALQVTRDLEVASNHPLAKAVRFFIDRFGGSLSGNKIPQVETVPGKGLRGKIVSQEDDELWKEYQPEEAILGNEKLVEDYGVHLTQSQTELITEWKTGRKSVILVGLKCEKLYKDKFFHLVLMMAARDDIRPEAKKVIEFLQNKNIDCWMITGDNQLTAEAIAKEIGIKNVVSEVLPDEKELQIKRIRQIKNKPVIAMVGDGINDAPAMASADVGIALSSGADLAITSSDFILLNKSFPLLSLVTLFDLSRTVFRRVKFNFGWSLVYNMIGLPIAAGVIYPYHNSRLDPVWASAAMALSSVSVVLSSLALKFYRPKFKASDFQMDESEVIEPKQHFT
ncbi:copper resistance-associated P-type ATPase [Spathaspora passalidarum NRRL Y-27907]|uniref:Copper resistance-associated P-type ATPase n=1 Tax=Spathaspora passalidarum (strain NRRL Y-27907 / 11-Y1) TaxID=619300 RepID=G3AMZ4_SPAPN|nr:copper resistance-associated P-type ATPase [Spathaspora passalidarum NRRL Y-27907]EGW32408.1 copper resistance-associated P-type ATPase [Spathaspora passalidarum NRRL Y-27907]